MIISDKYHQRAQRVHSLLCVGLDSDWHKLPDHLATDPAPQLTFNRAIIEATHDLAAAYKFNTAFYEARGDAGWRELKTTLDELRLDHPNIVTILDAKRADIGNTNNGYVEAIFDWLGFDAVTLHPYLGKEAIQPFLGRTDKASIILCRTSNPGAGEFQDLEVDGTPLWEIVAQRVVNEWNTNNNCWLVVGATYPHQMARIRTIAGDMPFLVPGIGAQGGDLEAALQAGLTPKGMGMVINASRSIIFASSGCDFAEAARTEAVKLQQAIHETRHKLLPHKEGHD